MIGHLQSLIKKAKDEIHSLEKKIKKAEDELENCIELKPLLIKIGDDAANGYHSLQNAANSLNKGIIIDGAGQGNKILERAQSINGLSLDAKNAVGNVNLRIKELEENSGVLVSQIESWSKSSDYYLEKYKLYCQNNFDKSRYNIFLTHDPQSIIRLSKEKNTCIHQNTDLVISGHMHNGLLPNVLKKIVKNKGLISPKMKLFPNFAQGEYKIDYTDFIIAGPVNTRVENAIINNLYGANATILTLKKNKIK